MCPAQGHSDLRDSEWGGPDDRLASSARGQRRGAACGGRSSRQGARRLVTSPSSSPRGGAERDPASGPAVPRQTWTQVVIRTGNGCGRGNGAWFWKLPGAGGAGLESQRRAGRRREPLRWRRGAPPAEAIPALGAASLGPSLCVQALPHRLPSFPLQGHRHVAPSPFPPLSLPLQNQHKNIFFVFILILERKGEGWKHRPCCLLRAPYWRPSPQTGPVPWPGIKLANCWFMGRRSTRATGEVAGAGACHPLLRTRGWITEDKWFVQGSTAGTWQP